MSSQILSNLRRLLLQRNMEALPVTLDSLEASLKKVRKLICSFEEKNKFPLRRSLNLHYTYKDCSVNKIEYIFFYYKSIFFLLL